MSADLSTPILAMCRNVGDYGGSHRHGTQAPGVAAGGDRGHWPLQWSGRGLGQIMSANFFRSGTAAIVLIAVSVNAQAAGSTMWGPDHWLHQLGASIAPLRSQTRRPVERHAFTDNVAKLGLSSRR